MVMKSSNTIAIEEEFIRKLNSVIEAALKYEELTSGKRRLGITGEVGEVLACYHLGLRLILDPIAEGYDAIDKDNKRVQIKTRRDMDETTKSKGRISRFSTHEFDYALLVFLDHDYQLKEIWRSDYNKLKPLFEKEKRRNPSLSAFKRVSEKIDLNLIEKNLV